MAKPSTCPIPENHDVMETFERDRYKVHAGQNDWEVRHTCIWVEARGERRIWFTVKPPEGIEAMDDDRPKEEIKKCEEHGDKALRTWIQVYKEKDGAENGKGGTYGGMQAWAAALKDSRMKPFVKEMGEDKVTWEPSKFYEINKEAYLQGYKESSRCR